MRRESANERDLRYRTNNPFDGKLNKYVFCVNPAANKVQIKHAIEKLFGKKVLDVNTCNYAGKAKRQRTASYGRTAHWKKAIVTLKEGDKIDLA